MGGGAGRRTSRTMEIFAGPVGLTFSHLPALAPLITRNGSSFVLGNHLNNRIINGVIQQLVQGCRGTSMSLLSACSPTELTPDAGITFAGS